MLGNLPLYLQRLYRSIWFLPSAYALGSVATLVAAPVLGAWMPVGAVALLRADALQKILAILASSMLAVAIFSIGTMVSSLEAASSAATPRARVLLTEDRTAQLAISTFIGAFIFGILGIIGVSTDYYSQRSVAFIFASTLFIIAVVIVVMISWIHRLSQIGGVEEVIRMVEHKTLKTFTNVAKERFYSGRSYLEAPADLEKVYTSSFGYLQHIDGDALGKITKEQDVDLYVAATPGALIGHRQPIVLASTKLNETSLKRIRECFVFGEQRTFEEDPRFGLFVLSEIASRGLSSAVNDAGTAIHVLGAIVRILRHWRINMAFEEVEVHFPRLHVPALDVDAVLIDGFRWIARDGAKHLEVAMQVQQSLADLRSPDTGCFEEAIDRMSEEAIERARSVMEDYDFAMLLEHRKALARDEHSIHASPEHMARATPSPAQPEGTSTRYH